MPNILSPQHYFFVSYIGDINTKIVVTNIRSPTFINRCEKYHRCEESSAEPTKIINCLSDETLNRGPV